MLCGFPARGTEYWQDTQNSNGFLPVVAPVTGACFEYATAAFDLKCYTTIPSGFITGPAGSVAFFNGTGALVGDATLTYSEGGDNAITIENTGGTNTAQVVVVDDNIVGSIRSYGASFTHPSLAGMFGVFAAGSPFATTGLALLGESTLISGGPNVISLRAGGFDTPAENLLLTATSSTFTHFPVVVSNLAGGGTLCVEVDNTGKFITAAGPCGTGSGTVTTVTGTPPIFITSTPTTTPNVTIQGAIVSGSTSTAGQNIGAISTAPLGCVTSGGVCTIDGLTLAGGLHFNTGTGAETLDTFSCGANTFVSSSSTSGLACTQPSFANLSGAATCGQLPTSGDLSGCNVVGFENAAAMRGDIVVTEVAAPSTPATGTLACYGDSTSLNWACKDELGNVKHGMRDFTCTTSKWASAGNSGGTTTCTQPAFTDVSGSVACGQLPAFGGDLSSAGGTCSVQVNALEETGGPTRLALGAVPDNGSGDFSILNRPGGTATVVGTESRTVLAGAPRPLAYAASIASIPVSEGWLYEGGNNTGFSSSAVEYPTGRIAVNCTLNVNLTSNGISSGTQVITVTRNGTGIGGGSAINVVSSTATGVYTTGIFSCGGGATTDTYGVEVTNSATGSIAFTAYVLVQ